MTSNLLLRSFSEVLNLELKCMNDLNKVENLNLRECIERRILYGRRSTRNVCRKAELIYYRLLRDEGYKKSHFERVNHESVNLPPPDLLGPIVDKMKPTKKPGIYYIERKPIEKVIEIKEKEVIVRGNKLLKQEQYLNILQKKDYDRFKLLTPATCCYLSSLNLDSVILTPQIEEKLAVYQKDKNVKVFSDRWIFEDGVFHKVNGSYEGKDEWIKCRRKYSSKKKEVVETGEYVLKNRFAVLQPVEIYKEVVEEEKVEFEKTVTERVFEEKVDISSITGEDMHPIWEKFQEYNHPDMIYEHKDYIPGSRRELDVQLAEDDDSDDQIDFRYMKLMPFAMCERSGQVLKENISEDKALKLTETFLLRKFLGHPDMSEMRIDVFFMTLYDAKSKTLFKPKKVEIKHIPSVDQASFSLPRYDPRTHRRTEWGVIVENYLKKKKLADEGTLVVKKIKEQVIQRKVVGYELVEATYKIMKIK